MQTRRQQAIRETRGFTLIELLVVVAVIALLISILVPSLEGARRLARTAACGANLHGIDQAMAEYASEWDQAILGNAHTSSSLLFNSGFTNFATGVSETSVPVVVSTNDWMTPAAAVMGINFDAGPTTPSRKSRFQQFDSFKAFICPENDIVVTSYTADGGPDLGTNLLISYNTSIGMQYVSDNTQSRWQGVAVPPSFVNMGGYRPRIDEIGNAAQKVFIADGGRFLDSGGGPDSNFDLGDYSSASPGGLSSDWGPWDTTYTRAYNATGAGGLDGRTLSMRHGERTKGGKYASFKFNLAFFDGHVEAMDGVQGSDPSLWLPTNSTVDSGDWPTAPELTAQYGNGPRPIH